VKQRLGILGCFCALATVLLLVCAPTTVSSSGNGGSTTTDNAKVVGAALYADGIPAKKASVRIRPEAYVRGFGPEPDSVIRHDTTTDEGGRYFIDSLKVGKYHIEINDKTSAAFLLSCDIATKEDSIVRPADTLRSYGNISGKVDSTTLKKASLFVQVFGLDRIVKVDSVTGAYNISDLPPGEYKLRVVSTDTGFKPIVIDTVKTDTAAKQVVIDTADTTRKPPIANALWTKMGGPEGGQVYCFAVAPNPAGGGLVFAGTSNAGVFVSDNYGASWSAVNTGLDYYSVEALAAVPNNGGGYSVFAGMTTEGPYKTTDNGARWSLANNGLSPLCWVSDFATRGNVLYGASTDKMIVTIDDGATWTAHRNVPSEEIQKIAVGPNGIDIFVGSGSSGIFHSSDGGVHWDTLNNGLTNKSIHSITVSSDGAAVLAGTGGGLFRSIDNGANWIPVSNGLPANTSFFDFLPLDENIYAGANNGVFVSADNGVTWTGRNTGLGSLYVDALAAIPRSAGGGLVFMAGADDGAFVSEDSCATWNKSVTGLSGEEIYAIAANGKNVYISTSQGLFLSVNDGNNWRKISDVFAKTLVCYGNMVLAGGYNGVYNSVDNGATWVFSRLPITSSWQVVAIVVGKDGRVFAGIGGGDYSQFPGGVFVSADNGATWAAANSGLPQSIIRALVANGQNIFAGMSNGVFRSSDNGVSWAAVNTGLPDTNVLAFGVNNGAVFVSLGAGVYSSANNGATWMAVNTGLTNTHICSFVAVDGTIFAGASEGEVFRTDNNGSLWTPENAGIINKYYFGLAANEAYLFARTDGSNVWRRPLR
jgi:hypothetical protein